MLICNVSLRPKRSAIAAELAEAAAADDASTSGTLILATLVDDPAAVSDTFDAYLGTIMLEIASASDVVDGTTGALPAGPPLDGTSPSGAWSLSRKLVTAYGGSYYAATSGAISTIYDQSGNSHNFVDQGTSARDPAVTTAGPNARTAANFNGTSHFLLIPTSSPGLITASDGFIVCSAIVNSITQNNATVYGNDALLGDSLQYYGFYLRNTAGGTLYAYNYDGTVGAPSTTISLGVPVVLTYRHQGGNLYVSVNNGTEISVASGNCQNITNTVGLCGYGTQYSHSTIFEVASWTTVPDATTRAAIVADFKSWIGA